MTERLKRAVIYSIALGPRFLNVENAEFVGPKYLTISTALIALVTMSVVNVSAISMGFILVSLVTNGVFLEEECLPSFVVLNLATSCLDDENEILLKVIASFSAVISFDSSPQLGKIIVLLHVLNKISQFFPFMLTDVRFWMSLFSLGSSDEVASLLRKSSRLVITSSISAGTCSSWSLCRLVGMWCDAALS